MMLLVPLPVLSNPILNTQKNMFRLKRTYGFSKVHFEELLYKSDTKSIQPNEYLKFAFVLFIDTLRRSHIFYFRVDQSWSIYVIAA